jgi:hypothetical protein
MKIYTSDGKGGKMKYYKFLLIAILMSNSLLANMVPFFSITELYFDSENNWHIELRCILPEEKFEGYFLKSKSDSSSFISGLEFDESGFLLLDNSSMAEPVYIDKNGDNIEIDGERLSFGPGEKYKAPQDGQSLCLYGEYYLDNSPTLGHENDRLDACCTISGNLKDSTDNPIDSVKVCLNKYTYYYHFTYCRDSTYTDTDGYFELHPLAYAYPSTLEFTKDQYDTTKIDSLNLDPDSTYNLGNITLQIKQGGILEPQNKISQFSLSQNYPNPFTKETKIVFTLPETLPTLLEVYNSQGQKVKTPVKGTISNGKHEVLFNAGELSSGVYIYKLRAGRYYSASRKLIITK